ncbi:MAG: RluA family pseudouridine synthase [bacterium]|nr:RluA family pseudouridine synthase [bacterium]
MIPKILLEDESILVVDKPAGLVVNRAESVKGQTVQDWVDKNAKLPMLNAKWDLESDFAKRSGIVHRIDKETSGILLIAKTPEAFEELQRQFKAREVEKTYLALVHGEVKPTEGEIKAPVGRLPWNRERFGVLAGGRESETRYKVTKLLSYSDKKQKEHFSLVEFYPKTGRTHQIRVHAKYIHHALVGDTFYAGRKTSRNDREWCLRLFLHAAKISFTHPQTKKRIEINSPLPSDLKKALTHLS